MKQKKIGKWIAGLLLLGVVVFAAVWFATSSGRADRMLQAYAYSWNLRCPTMMGGKDVILNRVVALPDRLVVYQLSSALLPKNVFEEVLDLNEFREKARANAIEELLAQPDLKKIRRLGITFRYDYKDVNDVPLMTFDITPEDYK